MNGGCQQSCTNTFGSFRCSCEQGYRLLDDGLQCEGKYIHLLERKQMRKREGREGRGMRDEG